MGAEVAQPGGREQRVAGRVGRDVGVGVAGQSLRLLGPASPASCIGTPSARRWTSVPTPTRRLGFTGRSCLSNNRSGEDQPMGPTVGMAAGRARGGSGRAGDELFPRDPARDPRLPGRRRRRARRRAQPGPARRVGHPPPRPLRQAAAGRRGPAAARSRLHRHRLAGGPPVVPGAGGVRRDGGGRGARGGAERVDRGGGVPAPGRRLRHLGGHPRPAHPAAAQGAARRRGRRRRVRGAASCSGRPSSGSLALGLTGLGRLLGRGRRAVEASGPCSGCPGSPSPGSPPAPGSGSPACRRGETPTDDFYRIDTALAIPRSRRGVAAADPRHGRAGAGAELPGPARPPAHRGVGDALLRLQPGRRRPDRQRLVERRPGRATCSPRPAAARRPTRCCRPPRTAGPAARRWRR